MRNVFMSNLLNNMPGIFRFCLTIVATAMLHACGGNNTPLDADTRATIDSTANAQIAKARVELDSLCAAAERNQMTQLVDSIKKVRLREIEEQLRLVPK